MLATGVADSLLGADCGPQSRAYRAEQLTGRLLARYPAVPAGALKAAVAGMQAAAAGGGDMTAAATAYQAALAGSLGPVLGASAGEPVLLRLSRLPGAAEDFLVVRARLGAFCATASAGPA